MGLKSFLGDVLEFLRVDEDDGHITDVKLDPGDGDVLTALHAGPPGEDSFPLEADQVVAVPAVGAGNYVCLGYLDLTNEPLAGPGEKRFYARDSDGSITAVVWIKADGSVHLADGTGAAALTRDDKAQAELERLKGELDELKADIQAIVQAINAGAPSPMDGGAGLKATIVAALAGVPKANPQAPGETACERVFGT